MVIPLHAMNIEYKTIKKSLDETFICRAGIVETFANKPLWRVDYDCIDHSWYRYSGILDVPGAPSDAKY